MNVPPEVAGDWKKQVAEAMSDGTGSFTRDYRITKGFFESVFRPASEFSGESLRKARGCF